MTASDDRRGHCDRAVRSLATAIGVKRPDALYARHPSPEGALEAGVAELTAGGLTDTQALCISLVPELARYMRREAFGPKPILRDRAAAVDYLRALYPGIAVERFYLLCLSGTGSLIECVLLQEGTLDEAPFYVAEILRTVALHDAAAVVLCHNHPGGTPRPSRADIDCTVAALRALRPLGVALLDHIIIAADRGISIRADGYIDPPLWTPSGSGNRLFLHWLDR